MKRLASPKAILVFLSLIYFVYSGTLTITPTNTRINAVSDYRFILQETFTVAVSAGSTVVITFPSQYNSILPASPNCINLNALTLSCSRTSGTTITITNLFNSADSNTIFFFRITNMVNPSITGTTGIINAAIFPSGSSTSTLTGGVAVLITEGICSLSITPSSHLIGGTGTYNFAITLTNELTSGAGIQVTFPKWSPKGETMIVSTTTSQTISPFTLSTSTPTISYATLGDTITAASFTNQAILAGSTITYSFGIVRNAPVATAYNISIRTLDTSNRGVDSCSALVSMNIPNNLTAAPTFIECFTNANIKFVNTDDRCTLRFILKNPLDTSAVIQISFPPEVDIAGLSKIYRDQPNPSFDEFTPVRIGTTNTIQVSGTIASYLDAGTTLELRFVTFKHPRSIRPTTSFAISTIVGGSTIDMLTAGAMYTADVASCSFTVTADTFQAGATATLRFTIFPRNPLTTSGGVVISFPSEFTVADGTYACTGQGSSIQNTPTCVSTSRVMNITNLLLNAITSADTIIISIPNIRLPTSTKPTANAFLLQTTEAGFAVDQNNSVFFTSTVATITNIDTVRVSSGAQVGRTSTYSLSFRNTNPVPSTGYFILTLPSEITIATGSDLTTIQNGGSTFYIGNTPSSVSVTVDQTVTPNILRITNPAGLIPANTNITFQIPALTNPLNTGSSSSFLLGSYTSYSDPFIIDQIVSGWGLVAGTISATDFFVSISASNTASGRSSTYNVTFIPSIANIATDRLVFKFDSSFSIPGSGVRCQVLSPTIAAQASCQPDLSNIFTITLGQPVAAGATFIVRISGFSNPISSKSYTGFTATTTNLNGNSIHSKTSGISLSIDTSVITQAFISRSTKNISTSATYTISFFPINNPYPNSVYYEIQIPSQVSFAGSSITCQYLSGVGVNPTCQIKPVTSGTPNTILIQNGGTYTSPINITVSSIINPATQTATDSFQIRVYDSSGNMIDKLTTGLFVFAGCDSSCRTCSDSDMFYCLSCNSPLKLDTTTARCNSSCLGSTYELNGQCLACHPSCKTCNGAGASACSSCSSTSTLKFLENNVCKSSCSQTFYADTNNVCQSCNSPCSQCTSASDCSTCISTHSLLNKRCYNPCPGGTYADSGSCSTCKSTCLTCSSLSTCLSCNSASSFPILYNGECVNSCPTGYFRSGNTCQKCQSPCLTCSLSATQCDSCTAGLYLSLGQCLSCQSPCKDCNGSPTQCSSCLNNLYLQGTSCVSGCSGGFYLDSSIGQCVKCISPCLTCSSIDKCLSCDTSSGKNYLYGSTCVTTCPADAPHVKLGICTSSDPNIIIIGGSSNSTNPYTGVYLTSGLPVPFILLSILFIFVCYIAKTLHHDSNIAGNVIGFLGIIEWTCYIAYVAIVLQSHPDDGPTVEFVIGVMAIVLNLIICVLFNIFVAKKYVYLDAQFQEWRDKSKPNKFASYVVFGFTYISYKSFRLIYSHFFGKECFSAKINNYEVYHKRLTLFSFMNFICTCVPICIAAVFTLNRDQWKQTIMISVEIILVTIFNLIATIYEALKQNEVKKILPEDPEVTQTKMLSALEKSILERLNESVETFRKSDKRPLSRSAFKRRLSMTMESDVEYHEGEMERAPGSMHRLGGGSVIGSERRERMLDMMNSSNDEFMFQNRDNFNGEETMHIEAIKEQDREEDEEDVRNFNRTAETIKKEKRTPEHHQPTKQANTDVMAPEFADGEAPMAQIYFDRINGSEPISPPRKGSRYENGLCQESPESGNRPSPEFKPRIQNEPGSGNSFGKADTRKPSLSPAINDYNSAAKSDTRKPSLGNEYNSASKSDTRKPSLSPANEYQSAYGVKVSHTKKTDRSNVTSGRKSDVKALEISQDQINPFDENTYKENKENHDEDETENDFMKNGEEREDNDSQGSEDSRAEIEKLTREYNERMKEYKENHEKTDLDQAIVQAGSLDNTSMNGSTIPLNIMMQHGSTYYNGSMHIVSNQGSDNEEELEMTDSNQQQKQLQPEPRISPKKSPKKGSPKKDPNRILYESTESMASDDERFGAFNEDTPSNYNILNQRFDDEVPASMKQNTFDSRKSTPSALNFKKRPSHEKLSPVRNTSTPNSRIPVEKGEKGSANKRNNFMTEDASEENLVGKVQSDVIGSRRDLIGTLKGVDSFRSRPPLASVKTLNSTITNFKRNPRDNLKSRESESEGIYSIKHDRSRSVTPTEQIKMDYGLIKRRKTPDPAIVARNILGETPGRMRSTDSNFRKGDHVRANSSEEENQFHKFEKKKKKKKKVVKKEDKKPKAVPVDFAKINQLEEIYLQRLDHPGSKRGTPSKKIDRVRFPEINPNNVQRDDDGLELSDFENFENNVNHLKMSRSGNSAMASKENLHHKDLIIQSDL